MKLMNKYDLVTVGHILLDVRVYVDEFPEVDKSAIVKIIESSVGGCGANVAVDAQRLGLKTAMIGNIGRDEKGEWILKRLKKEKIETKGINKVGKKTGTSIISINKKGEVKIEEFLGANEPLKKINKKLIENSNWLQMSSTTPSALEEASKIAKENGKWVSFDPGRSLSQLGMRKLDKILRNTCFLILNRKEVRAIAKTKSYEEGAKKLVEKYGFVVVVKASKDPTHIFTGSKESKVKTFKVRAVDFIGAGDAFDAGFIYSIMKGKKIEDAVKFANAVGAVKVTRRGADSITPRKEINALLKH